MNTNWIEHDGKSMPVPGDTFVYVKFRDGTDDFGSNPWTANKWGGNEEQSNWIHNQGKNSSSEIIAYMIVPAEE